MLDELAGREVWLVNALYGIRFVDGWIGVGIAAGEPGGPRPGVRGWRTWSSRCPRAASLHLDRMRRQPNADEHGEPHPRAEESGSRNTWPWELSALATSTS